MMLILDNPVKETVAGGAGSNLSWDLGSMYSHRIDTVWGAHGRGALGPFRGCQMFLYLVFKGAG